MSRAQLLRTDSAKEISKYENRRLYFHFSSDKLKRTSMGSGEPVNTA